MLKTQIYNSRSCGSSRGCVYHDLDVHCGSLYSTGLRRWGKEPHARRESFLDRWKHQIKAKQEKEGNDEGGTAPYRYQWAMAANGRDDDNTRGPFDQNGGEKVLQ